MGCALDSAIDSDALLRLVLWTAAGVFCVAILLMIAIAYLRVALVLRQRREQRFIAQWRPLLSLCVEADPASLPVVARADQPTFFSLWNYFHESLRGESKDRLNRLAASCGMDRLARTLLGRRNLRARLMAVTTLGNLRDRSVWEELKRLAADPHPLLSLSAARALLLIDASAALPTLIPLLAARAEWDAARVASMLSEAGADVVSAPLAAAAESASAGGLPQQTARLLRYLAVLHSGEELPAVGRILDATTDDDLIAACIKCLNDPRDLPRLRNFVDHHAWFVRVQAARALGRIGTPADCARLVCLLGDPVWWVRYRAAQALTALPFIDLARLRQIHIGLSDRFAGDILAHAIAEKYPG